MELATGTLSLMWVVGLFTLQRIDRLIDEYYAGIAYYLSLGTNGVVNKTQLEVITILPKPGLDTYLDSLISLCDTRKDNKALIKFRKFLDLSIKIKMFIEFILVIVTILVPIVYFIDFNNVPIITVLNKDWLLYISLFIVSISSIIIEKLLSCYSKTNWPINITIGVAK